jgi:hypothetical protein
MPSVRLGRYEIEEYDPPDVCMKCGARSTVVVRRTFAWSPPWIIITILAGLLIYAILAMVMTKRMNVKVPLCQEHKGHWTMRTLSILLGFLGILVFVGLAIFLSSEESDLATPVWLLVVALLLAWLVLVIVFQYTAIRPTEITDRSITLTGVSEGYIEALREERGDSDDEDRPRSRRRRDDDDDRPRRSSRRDDDDADRPRKRRPLPEDEEDEAPRPKAKDRSDGVYDPKKSKRRQEDSEAIQGEDE